MIYTSYFANLRNIPSDIVPISICGKAHEWSELTSEQRLYQWRP